MRLGLDYDGTYTLDQEFWDEVIAIAKARGHSVWIVTCRPDTPENREDVKVLGCYTVFTDMAPKRWHCEQRGLRIDVWIDDDPGCVERGK